MTIKKFLIIILFLTVLIPFAGFYGLHFACSKAKDVITHSSSTTTISQTGASIIKSNPNKPNLNPSNAKKEESSLLSSIVKVINPIEFKESSDRYTIFFKAKQDENNKIEVIDLKGKIEVKAIIINKTENSSSERTVNQKFDLSKPYNFNSMQINYIRDSYVIEIPFSSK